MELIVALLGIFLLTFNNLLLMGTEFLKAEIALMDHTNYEPKESKVRLRVRFTSKVIGLMIWFSVIVYCVISIAK